MRLCLIGGGVLARHIARAAAARRDVVLATSPNPSNIPGLWILGDAVSGRGLRRAARGADVVIWAASAQDDIEELYGLGVRNAVVTAQHESARLVVCGPRGASPGGSARSLRAWYAASQALQDLAPNAIELRFPPMFGAEAHLLGPWLKAAEQKKPLRVPSPSTQVAPLWIEDAVRAVLEAADGTLIPGVYDLAGPEVMTLDALARQVEARFGATRAFLPPLFWRREDQLRLSEQLAGADAWDELDLGPRSTVEQVLDGLSASRYASPDPTE